MKKTAKPGGSGGGSGGSPGAKSKIPKLMKGSSPAASPSTSRRAPTSPAIGGGATIAKPVAKPVGRKSGSSPGGQDSNGKDGTGTTVKANKGNVSPPTSSVRPHRKSHRCYPTTITPQTPYEDANIRQDKTVKEQQVPLQQISTTTKKVKKKKKKDDLEESESHTTKKKKAKKGKPEDLQSLPKPSLIPTRTPIIPDVVVQPSTPATPDKLKLEEGREHAQENRSVTETTTPKAEQPKKKTSKRKKSGLPSPCNPSTMEGLVRASPVLAVIEEPSKKKNKKAKQSIKSPGVSTDITAAATKKEKKGNAAPSVPIPPPPADDVQTSGSDRGRKLSRGSKTDPQGDERKKIFGIPIPRSLSRSRSPSPNRSPTSEGAKGPSLFGLPIPGSWSRSSSPSKSSLKGDVETKSVKSLAATPKGSVKTPQSKANISPETPATRSSRKSSISSPNKSRGKETPKEKLEPSFHSGSSRSPSPTSRAKKNEGHDTQKSKKKTSQKVLETKIRTPHSMPDTERARKTPTGHWPVSASSTMSRKKEKTSPQLQNKIVRSRSVSPKPSGKKARPQTLDIGTSRTRTKSCSEGSSRSPSPRRQDYSIQKTPVTITNKPNEPDSEEELKTIKAQIDQLVSTRSGTALEFLRSLLDMDQQGVTPVTTKENAGVIEPVAPEAKMSKEVVEEEHESKEVKRDDERMSDVEQSDGSTSSSSQDSDDVEELSVQLSGKLDISITSMTTTTCSDTSSDDSDSSSTSETSSSSTAASVRSTRKMSVSMAELQAVASNQERQLLEEFDDVINKQVEDSDTLEESDFKVQTPPPTEKSDEFESQDEILDTSSGNDDDSSSLGTDSSVTEEETDPRDFIASCETSTDSDEDDPELAALHEASTTNPMHYQTASAHISRSVSPASSARSDSTVKRPTAFKQAELKAGLSRSPSRSPSPRPEKESNIRPTAQKSRSPSPRHSGNLANLTPGSKVTSRSPSPKPQTVDSGSPISHRTTPSKSPSPRPPVEHADFQITQASSRSPSPNPRERIKTRTPSPASLVRSRSHSPKHPKQDNLSRSSSPKPQTESVGASPSISVVRSRSPSPKPSGQVDLSRSPSPTVLQPSSRSRSVSPRPSGTPARSRSPSPRSSAPQSRKSSPERLLPYDSKRNRRPSSSSTPVSRAGSPVDTAPSVPHAMSQDRLVLSRGTSPIIFDTLREIIDTVKEEKRRSRSPGPSSLQLESKAKTSRSTSPFPMSPSPPPPPPLPGPSEELREEGPKLFGIPIPRLSRSRSPSMASSRSASPSSQIEPQSPTKRPTILGITLPTIGRSRSPSPRPTTPKPPKEEDSQSVASEDSFKDAEEALLKAEQNAALETSGIEEHQPDEIDVVVRITQDGEAISVVAVESQEVSNPSTQPSSPVLQQITPSQPAEEFKRSAESVESDMMYTSTDDDTYTVTSSSENIASGNHYFDTCDINQEPEEIFTIIEETAQELEENEKEDTDKPEVEIGHSNSGGDTERDRTLERILVMMETLTAATATATTAAQSSTPSIAAAAAACKPDDSSDSEINNWKAESCPDLMQTSQSSQRDLGKEVEFALENIIEMKSTMTKMMQLLETSQAKSASQEYGSPQMVPSVPAKQEEDLIDRALDAMIEGDCKMVDEIIVEVEKVLAPQGDKSGVSEDHLLPVHQQRQLFEAQDILKSSAPPTPPPTPPVRSSSTIIPSKLPAAANPKVSPDDEMLLTVSSHDPAQPSIPIEEEPPCPPADDENKSDVTNVNELSLEEGNVGSLAEGNNTIGITDVNVDQVEGAVGDITDNASDENQVENNQFSTDEDSEEDQEKGQPTIHGDPILSVEALDSTITTEAGSIRQKEDEDEGPSDLDFSSTTESDMIHQATLKVEDKEDDAPDTIHLTVPTKEECTNSERDKDEEELVIDDEYLVENGSVSQTLTEQESSQSDVMPKDYVASAERLSLDLSTTVEEVADETPSHDEIRLLETIGTDEELTEQEKPSDVSDIDLEGTLSSTGSLKGDSDDPVLSEDEADDVDNLPPPIPITPKYERKVMSETMHVDVKSLREKFLSSQIDVTEIGELSEDIQSDHLSDEAKEDTEEEATVVKPTPGETFAEITETTIDSDTLVKSDNEVEMSESSASGRNLRGSHLINQSEDEDEVPDITCSLCKFSHAEECSALKSPDQTFESPADILMSEDSGTNGQYQWTRANNGPASSEGTLVPDAVSEVGKNQEHPQPVKLEKAYIETQPPADAICVTTETSTGKPGGTDVKINHTTTAETQTECNFEDEEFDEVNQELMPSGAGARKRMPRSYSESNLKRILKFSVSMDRLDTNDVLTISFEGDIVNIQSSSRLMAKSSIDISQKNATVLSLKSSSSVTETSIDPSTLPRDTSHEAAAAAGSHSKMNEESAPPFTERSRADMFSEAKARSEEMVSAEMERSRRFSEGIPPKLPPPKLYFFDNDPLRSPERGDRLHRRFDTPARSTEDDSIEYMEDDELEAALHQGFTRAVTRAEVMPDSYQHFHHHDCETGDSAEDEAAIVPATKLFKILFIGSSSTGKTSLIRRYVKQTFAPSYRATIGADFLAKVVEWDQKLTLRLQLWDIAGQDRFSLLSRSFYKDAAGAFVVSDISRPETLEAVVRWKEELDAKVRGADGLPIPCFLLANKCDLLEEGDPNKQFQSKQHNRVCHNYGFGGWMLTSAKENINVNEAIEMLLKEIADKEVDQGLRSGLPAVDKGGVDDQASIKLEIDSKKKSKGSCKC